MKHSLTFYLVSICLMGLSSGCSPGAVPVNVPNSTATSTPSPSPTTSPSPSPSPSDTSTGAGNEGITVYRGAGNPNTTTAMSPTTTPQINDLYVDMTSAQVYVLTSSGWIQMSLATPYGIAFDSANNIYVADCGNNRIAEYNSAGAFIGSFGSYGTANDQFNCPMSIVLDTTGNFYVVDQGNNRVSVFDSSWSFSFAIGSGGGNYTLAQPSSVALDSSGNIYVADSNNDRIAIFNSSGGYTSQIHQSGLLPLSIAIYGDTLYTADFGSNTVFKTDLSGGNKQVILSESGGRYVAAVSVDTTGNIYIADTDYVYLYSSGGSLSSRFSADSPYGIAVNNGNIFITTQGNVLQEYNSSGTLIWGN